jgi:chromosome partitioning protein
MTARIISICNEKGGVAKTTTTAAFADGLANRSYRVLCVDIDPQPGNLSLSLGGDRENVIGTYEVFTSRPGFHEPKEFIQTTAFKNCDLIAANKDVAHIEGLLSNTHDKESRLKNVLEPLREEYDFILVDTPPALGILTLNALAAADEVIIPTLADYYSVHGVVDLVKNIRALAKSTNPSLKIAGILITQFRGHTNVQTKAERAIEELSAHLHTTVYSTRIPLSVAIQETQFLKTSLSRHKPHSPGARAYSDVVDEYLKRQKK